jgi:hypothetical protein
LERDYWEDQGVDGRIIKLFVKGMIECRLNRKQWKHLVNRINLGVHKVQGIS